MNKQKHVTNKLGFESSSWTIAQLLIWVSLRSPAAVDAIGPDSDPLIEWRLRLSAPLHRNPEDAGGEIRVQLIAGNIDAWAFGPDRKTREKLSIDQLKFLWPCYVTLAFSDPEDREYWEAVRFPKDQALKLWPSIAGESSPAECNQ